ncbi:uncharacterized protein LY79DRAFT_551157 [Colletotrichum navitas]|uniref:Uncharacterized protein n=1 Tax=Colletotrichum navitas TaxID=681940 RepID=A0AAD8Q1N9_9PEZI|nr:uncharacterized protein LY79DRAFT_551157 [Colletotrichum navitas]KAK1593875.1 hypothetical protein LY79DRAFT_551157 [Colletotrichum navitas]
MAEERPVPNGPSCLSVGSRVVCFGPIVMLAVLQRNPKSRTPISDIPPGDNTRCYAASYQPALESGHGTQAGSRSPGRLCPKSTIDGFTNWSRLLSSRVLEALSGPVKHCQPATNADADADADAKIRCSLTTTSGPVHDVSTCISIRPVILLSHPARFGGGVVTQACCGSTNLTTASGFWYLVAGSQPQARREVKFDSRKTSDEPLNPGSG